MTGSSDAFGGRSREEYEQRVLAKLQPSAIRSTLSFAGLYQMTHEMLKHAILEKVRNFYCIGFDQDGFTFDEKDTRGTSSTRHALKRGLRTTTKSSMPPRLGWSARKPSRWSKPNFSRTFTTTAMN